MIEFIIWIIIVFFAVIFVIIFLRKDIFYTSGNGDYISLSTGECQNGTRYQAYICETLNGKGCLDKFGNLTFDIKLVKEQCIVPPNINTGVQVSTIGNVSTFQNSVVPSGFSSSRGLSRSISQDICQPPPEISCSSKPVKGTRNLIQDCSGGCLESSYWGVKIQGGYSPGNIVIGTTVHWEDMDITRNALNLFTAKKGKEKKAYTLDEISSVLNVIKKEEECEAKLPPCEAPKGCQLNEIIIASCDAPHFQLGTIDLCKRLVECVGYSPKDDSHFLTKGFLLFEDQIWTNTTLGNIYCVKDLKNLKKISIYFCVIPIDISDNDVKCYLYAFGTRIRGWVSGTENRKISPEREVYHFEIRDDRVFFENKETKVLILPFDSDNFHSNSLYKFLSSRSEK